MGAKEKNDVLSCANSEDSDQPAHIQYNQNPKDSYNG